MQTFRDFPPLQFCLGSCWNKAPPKWGNEPRNRGVGAKKQVHRQGREERGIPRMSGVVGTGWAALQQRCLGEEEAGKTQGVWVYWRETCSRDRSLGFHAGNMRNYGPEREMNGHLQGRRWGQEQERKWNQSILPGSAVNVLTQSSNVIMGWIPIF